MGVGTRAVRVVARLEGTGICIPDPMEHIFSAKRVPELGPFRRLDRGVRADDRDGRLSVGSDTGARSFHQRVLWVSLGPA